MPSICSVPVAGPVYKVPDIRDHHDFVAFVKNLPSNTPPEVFGLHENANITKSIQESNLLMNSLLLTQSQSSGGEGEVSIGKGRGRELGKGRGGEEE
jgi:dynein heavy chain